MTTLSRISAKSAAEVPGLDSLSEPGRSMLQAAEEPGAFLDRLLTAEQYPDAILFLAHALGPREAVWWAAFSVKTLLPKLTDPERVLLDQVDVWVRESKDDIRRRLFAAAQQLGLDKPACCVAAAAFFSTGSIAPPDQKEVPAPPGVAAQMIAASVLLGVVADADQVPVRSKQAITWGIDIGNGRLPQRA